LESLLPCWPWFDFCFHTGGVTIGWANTLQKGFLALFFSQHTDRCQHRLVCLHVFQKLRSLREYRGVDLLHFLGLGVGPLMGDPFSF
jgi:hypothetical protein